VLVFGGGYTNEKLKFASERPFSPKKTQYLENIGIHTTVLF